MVDNKNSTGFTPQTHITQKNWSSKIWNSECTCRNSSM